MFTRTLAWHGKTGFYIALHPWLRAAGFVKVGFSTSLEQRLHMASFKTCFTPEWRYHSTFECESRKEAMLLEQAVLYCFHDLRVPHRELLRIDADELAGAVAHIAVKLGIQSILTNYAASPSSACCAVDEKEMMDCEEYELKEPDVVVAPNRDGLPATLADDAAVEAQPPLVQPYVALLDVLRASLTPLAVARRGASANASSSALDEDIGELDDDDSLRLTLDAAEEEAYVLAALRPYQHEAVQRVYAELRQSGKAICQMACRCGKTPVAYHVMRRLLAHDGSSGQDHTAAVRILYLVPGLSLLRQTARKLYGYGLRAVPFLLIGSDPAPVRLDDTVSVSMTTDPETIRETVLGQSRVVVICTYHSSPLLAQLNVFGLTVFDECHRVCGSTEQTAFNTLLHLPPHGMRLFLTATPTYDTPVKMSETRLFGGIAYRYYLREGIDAGYVNPFAVRVVLGTSLQDLTPYIHEAMRLVDKMLVFCRNIEHAQTMYEQLTAAARPGDVQPFGVLIAHSRMGGAAVAEALRRFDCTRRCVLLNVRLFQEGIEIADLNAVFFASPRYSPRDIVQSICRPLTRVPDKPLSYVFLPAAFDTRYAADHPVNLQHFSTLVPFTDALMDEDPALFEYMIDPRQKRYNFSVVGLRSLRLTTEDVHDFVLPAIRRGVRYSAQNSDRLLRAARMPWKKIFQEMRRIVLECHRYPKTNDAWVVGETAVPMSTFYRYVRKGYALYATGQPTYLQPYQLRDLESLPQWSSYGLHGPYPWKECMGTLEALLRKHGRVPPLEVHKGGYVGLDATPLERLSGCLMSVNQSDTRTALRLPADKQSDLDALCKRYNLHWRKPRDANGIVISPHSTFITRCYEQFKYLYKHRDRHPRFQCYLDVHFPGYPLKHARMECLQNLRSDNVPPRQRMMPLTRNARPGRPRGRTVMCRVCREHVRLSEWEQHLRSRGHLRQRQVLQLSVDQVAQHSSAVAVHGVSRTHGVPCPTVPMD